VTPAEAAREVVKATREKMAWNYDTLQVAALNEVADSWEIFAANLEVSEENARG
jgi:hypothetical protein